jgi:hypothetical protein
MVPPRKRIRLRNHIILNISKKLIRGIIEKIHMSNSKEVLNQLTEKIKVKAKVAQNRGTSFPIK